METFGTGSLSAQKAARAILWLFELTRAEEHKSKAKRLLTVDAFATVVAAEASAAIFSGGGNRLAHLVAPHLDFSTKAGFSSLNYHLATKEFRALRELVEELRSRVGRVERPSLQSQPRGLKASRETWGISKYRSVVGHSVKTVIASIEAGRIPGASVSIDPASGRRKFSIPDAALRSIALGYSATDPIDAAAALAGCSLNAMQGLVRSGCIRSFRLTGVLHGRLAERISPGDVASMARTLFNLANVKAREEVVDSVHFSNWVQDRYLARGAPKWRWILEALRERRLQAHKPTEHPRALDDLYISRAALKAFLKVERIRRQKCF